MKKILIYFFLLSINGAHTLNINHHNSCNADNLAHQKAIASLVLTEKDIEAISRVVIAEAGNQGLSGKIAVIFIILNRYITGDFGHTISDVINKKWAFEPVTLAGGWNKLPKAAERERNYISNIIRLITLGYINDITQGSLYFQNPKIIKERIKIGTAKQASLHFNNSIPSAIIGNHYFYKVIESNHIDIKEIPSINKHPVLIFNKK